MSAHTRKSLKYFSFVDIVANACSLVAQCLKFADKFIFINAAKYVFQRNVEAADVPQQIRAVFGNVQLHPNNDTTNTRITNNVNGLEVRDDMLAETGKQRERDDLQRNSSWKALLFYFQPFTRIQFIGVVASLALLSMAEMSPGIPCHQPNLRHFVSVAYCVNRCLHSTLAGKSLA